MTDEAMWGKWKTSSEMPDLGDHLQVKGLNILTMEGVTHEGIVVKVTPIHFHLSGVKGDCMLAIEKWRRRYPPEYNPPLRSHHAVHRPSKAERDAFDAMIARVRGDKED